jgi:hypothetical protein
MKTSDTSTPTHNQISGLITRAHARQLNNQVSSFLASYSSYLDNRNMCSVLLLRNDEQEQTQSCTHVGDIRIPEQQQVLMVASTTYRLGFRHAKTLWKDHGVYFHMHQSSSPYHVGAGHNHYFGIENFFCQWCCDTLFWPIGPCIMLSPIRTRPRVGARPSFPEVILQHL